MCPAPAEPGGGGGGWLGTPQRQKELKVGRWRQPETLQELSPGGLGQRKRHPAAVAGGSSMSGKTLPTRAIFRPQHRVASFACRWERRDGGSLAGQRQDRGTMGLPREAGDGEKETSWIRERKGPWSLADLLCGRHCARHFTPILTQFVPIL